MLRKYVKDVSLAPNLVKSETTFLPSRRHFIFPQHFLGFLLLHSLCSWPGYGCDTQASGQVHNEEALCKEEVATTP